MRFRRLRSRVTPHALRMVCKTCADVVKKGLMRGESASPVERWMIKASEELCTPGRLIWLGTSRLLGRRLCTYQAQGGTNARLDLNRKRHSQWDAPYLVSPINRKPIGLLVTSAFARGLKVGKLRALSVPQGRSVAKGEVGAGHIQQIGWREKGCCPKSHPPWVQASPR